MKRECITIGKKGAVLHAYLHEQSENWRDYDKRPAMLICPGGGYEFVSDREMDPVALIGFSAGEYAHEGSFEKLTGRNRDDSWDEYSLESTDYPCVINRFVVRRVIIMLLPGLHYVVSGWDNCFVLINNNSCVKYIKSARYCRD